MKLAMQAPPRASLHSRVSEGWNAEQQCDAHRDVRQRIEVPEQRVRCLLENLNGRECSTELRRDYRCELNDIVRTGKHGIRGREDHGSMRPESLVVARRMM